MRRFDNVQDILGHRIDQIVVPLPLIFRLDFALLSPRPPLLGRPYHPHVNHRAYRTPVDIGRRVVNPLHCLEQGCALVDR